MILKPYVVSQNFLIFHEFLLTLLMYREGNKDSRGTKPSPLSPRYPEKQPILCPGLEIFLSVNKLKKKSRSRLDNKD